MTELDMTRDRLAVLRQQEPWAPDREIEVAAARQMFPRSSLAKVVVGRPGGTYSAEWSRFLES